MVRFAIPTAAVLLALGCQPAARFAPKEDKGRDGPSTPISVNHTPEDVPDEVTWLDPKGNAQKNVVAIVFVHALTSPDEWERLDKFWTQTNGPAQVASLIGTLPLGPLAGPMVAGPDPQVIKIKVPFGLDDPTPFIPAANPPTLAKWELGRDLFFDKSWLSAQGGNVSCSGCHIPAMGFTDGMKSHKGFNTPTLVNVVYNKSQFWDGRATYLEEVVARRPEDERDAGDSATFTHTWPGVIGRLRQDINYRARFATVFGTLPTQDAVGKALATYLRTLLAADSVIDRALVLQAQRKGKELGDYDIKKALDGLSADERAVLEPKGRTNDDVAADLFFGSRVFQQQSCVKCHPAPLYTDQGYHNIGLLTEADFPEGKLPGRYAHVPIGQRQRELVGAYKTPTLRGLLRTAPYFHNGLKDKLEDAVVWHTSEFHYNSYLDRAYRAVNGWDAPSQQYHYKPEELKALMLFLKGLNGGDVDDAVLPGAYRRGK